MAKNNKGNTATESVKEKTDNNPQDSQENEQGVYVAIGNTIKTFRIPGINTNIGVKLHRQGVTFRIGDKTKTVQFPWIKVKWN